jgi:primosomal protein N'
MSGWDKDRVADLIGGDVRTVTLAELADVRDAGLVVLFDVDAALSAPELIPDTLAASLVISAIRAAGRGGGVVALTDDPTQPLLADLFGPRDQLAVARRTLTAAKQAGLPPFGRLVTVRCGQERKPDVDRWPGTVHGPRRVGSEWEMIVRIPADKLLELEPHLNRMRRGGKTRITVA